MRNIFKFILPVVVGVVLATSAQAANSVNETSEAWAGHWLVRGRALGVLPDVSSSTNIGGYVDVTDTVVPELDFSYFFTNNIAAELILATSKHDIKAMATSSGNVDAGHAWALPPTLTVQYHFTQFDGLKPYVGAGINYTHFYDTKPGALTNVKYDDSFGGALQAGVDVPLQGNWFFNADVKKVWINTTAKFSNRTIRADVDIDPWLVGVGFGYRF